MSDTLAATATHAIDVRHSRFIAQAGHAASPDDAIAFLAAVRQDDATHNCWAYRIGDQYRSSDDGEPSGTAGRPILAAIDGQGLDQVVVVVARWFGGVKLGAGGLVRAYTDSVAQALLKADKIAIIRQRLLRCAVPYPLEGLVRRELELAGATLEQVEHADQVGFAFRMPVDKAEPLVARLNEAGSGRVAWIDDAPADTG